MKDEQVDLDVLGTVGEHVRKRKHRDVGPDERSRSQPAAKDDATQRLSEMRDMFGGKSEARCKTSFERYPDEKLPVNRDVAGQVLGRAVRVLGRRNRVAASRR